MYTDFHVSKEAKQWYGALFKAIERNDLEKVRSLVWESVDEDEEGDDDKEFERSFAEVSEWDLEETDKRGFTPLQAAAFRKDHDETTAGIVRELINAGVEIEAQNGLEGNTPLMLAVRTAKESSDPVVEALIAEGADVNARDECWGFSPLHWATRQSKYPKNKVAGLVERLIEAGAKIDEQDDHEETPMMVLLSYCQNEKNDLEKTVKVFIEHGAELNLQDGDGVTVLHYAVENFSGTEESKNVVLALIEAGADATIRDFDGETAKDCMLKNKHEGERKNFLVERLGKAEEQIFLKFIEDAYKAEIEMSGESLESAWLERAQEGQFYDEENEEQIIEDFRSAVEKLKEKGEIVEVRDFWAEKPTAYYPRETEEAQNAIQYAQKLDRLEDIIAQNPGLTAGEIADEYEKNFPDDVRTEYSRISQRNLDDLLIDRQEKSREKNREPIVADEEWRYFINEETLDDFYRFRSRIEEEVRENPGCTKEDILEFCRDGCVGDDAIALVALKDLEERYEIYCDETTELYFTDEEARDQYFAAGRDKIDEIAKKIEEMVAEEPGIEKKVLIHRLNQNNDFAVDDETFQKALDTLDVYMDTDEYCFEDWWTRTDKLAFDYMKQEAIRGNDDVSFDDFVLTVLDAEDLTAEDLPEVLSRLEAVFINVLIACGYEKFSPWLPQMK